MQDYNTIIGVIQMRQNKCSFSVIEARYHIGSGTAQRILTVMNSHSSTSTSIVSWKRHTVYVIQRWLLSGSLARRCTSTGSVTNQDS